MKNYKFYLYITLSVILFFILLSAIATPLIVRNQMTNFLNNQIQSAQQDAKELALLSGEFLKEDNGKEKVILGIQKGVKNSYEQIVYNSLIDWSGKILAYPDVTLISTIMIQDEALTSNTDTMITGTLLYDYLMASEKNNDRTVSNLIHLELIPESDMIIAAHINVNIVESTVITFKTQTQGLFLVIGLLSLLALLITTRILSSHYESQIALTSEKIEDSVGNLNASLERYQQSLLEVRNEPSQQIVEGKNTETSKQRLLTYVRNELVPVNVEDIAYIYVENKITYILCKDGRRSTSNESLDLIYSSLDENIFFRANRQTIISITAISKITKFSNNALKIQTNPLSEIDIVIGKNKAAQFRQWLNL